MKRVLIIALIATAFVGCNKDSNDDIYGSSASFECVDGDTTWTKGDQVGIYMVVTGAATLVVPVSGIEALNVPYAATTSSSTTTMLEPTSKTIYLPADGTVVDFYAYSPYTTSGVADGVYSIDISSQDIDSALRSASSTRVSNSNPNVKLSFVNQLTKLSLNLSTSKSISDLTDLSAKITGHYTTAKANLLSGELYDRGDIADMELNTSQGGSLVEGLLIPTESVAASTVIFTVGEEEYIWDISAIDFEAGTEITYNIEVDKVPVVIGEGEINPWGDGADAAIKPSLVLN